MPKSNVEYWTGKINRNVKRDAQRRFELDRLGWKLRIIWECETLSGVERLLEELSEGKRLSGKQAMDTTVTKSR